MKVNVGDALALVGDLAALVTVLFAYLALTKAGETITEAKKLRDALANAIRAAEEAASQAAADRQRAAEAAIAERVQAEQQRLARRVEHVGELIEELFWAAGEDRATDSTLWMDIRNRLRHAIVGLRERLPKSAEASNATTRAWAHQAAVLARNEIETELQYLYGEITRPS